LSRAEGDVGGVCDYMKKAVASRDLHTTYE